MKSKWSKAIFSSFLSSLRSQCCKMAKMRLFLVNFQTLCIYSFCTAVGIGKNTSVASRTTSVVMLWPSFSILQISSRRPGFLDALSHILNDDGNRQDSSVFQSFSRPCFGAKGHFIAKQCKAYCLTIKITLHLCMGIKLNQEFLRFSRCLKINLKSLAFLHFTTLRAKRA